MKWPTALDGKVDALAFVAGAQPALVVRYHDWTVEEAARDGLLAAGFSELRAGEGLWLRGSGISFSRHEIASWAPGVRFEVADREPNSLVIRDESKLVLPMASRAQRVRQRFVASGRNEVFVQGFAAASAALEALAEKRLLEPGVADAVAALARIKEHGVAAVGDLELIIDPDPEKALHRQAAEVYEAVAERVRTAGGDAFGRLLFDSSGAATVAQPQTEDTSASDASSRIDDVGEKIGGARKDFYAAGRLLLDSVAGMTREEKLLLVTKARIWPTLDLEDMRSNGVDPVVAFAINEVRRLIEPAPAKSESAESYVEGVSAIANAMQDVRSLDDFRKALVRLEDELLLYVGDRSPDHPREWTHRSQGPRYRAMREALGKDLFDSRKSKKKWISPPFGFDDMFLGNIQCDYRFRDFSRSIGEDRDKERDRAWEALLASRVRGGQKGAEEKTGDGKPERPHLDNLERDGPLPDWRSGRDVSPEELMETFRFRGVEFGNWLPQDERQKVCNFAFDAFSSLAEIIGIPAAGIGMSGRLALAFGARGKGKALAHYEPGRKVFNLTRLKGAGSIAHEYGHAIDHLIADLVRETLREGGNKVIDTKQGLLATGQFLNSKGQLLRFDSLAKHETFAPLQEAFIGSFRLFWQRMEDKSETTERLQARVAYSEEVLESWLRSGIREENPTLPDEQVREHARQAREQGMAYELAERFFPDKKSKRGVMEEQPGKINIERSLTSIERAKAELEWTAHSEGNPYAKAIPATMVAEAKKIDGKGGKYWASPQELFARSFECFVFDHMKDRGARDDYLVHGVEPERYAGQGGNPYPVGFERQQFNAAFVPLMKAIAPFLADGDAEENHERARYRPAA